MLDKDALKKAQFLFGMDAWTLYNSTTSMNRPYVVGYGKVNVDDGVMTKKSIWMGTGRNWEEALDAGRDQMLVDMNSNENHEEIVKLLRQILVELRSIKMNTLCTRGTR